MIFPPFTNLYTNRLILRELQLKDAEQILKIRSDPKVNEFIDRAPTASISESLNFINNILKNHDKKEAIMWAISLKNEPTLIGTIVYWHIVNEENKAEIGYELLSGYFGKGIMREALAEVIRFGFDTMQLKTIIAETKKDNLRSINVLQKCGFSDTGIAHDGYLVYQLRC